MRNRCVLVLLGVLAGCSGETPGPNRAPVALAGGDQVVDLFQPAQLDGGGSYDPDGDPIEYWWDLVARPESGTADLSTPAQAVTGLTPDAVGVWVVRLTVSDGSLNSQPDILRVRASGKPCTGDPECNDGLYCNGEESCVDGWCAPGSLDCSVVADQCNHGGCDEDADTCVAVPQADGTGCDDGRWCTEKDACAGGVCTGSVRDCSQAAGECVAGVCNEAAQQCEGQPMADGDLCDDGKYCTVNSRCSGGQCLGGDLRDCSSAGGGCVDGVCDEEQDACVGDPLMAGTPCSDGWFCTVDDACDGLGNCVGELRDCSGLSNQCNQGMCNEDSDQCVPDPINEGQGCNDGLYCTQGETCQSGFCTGGQWRDCDDSDPCTYDACDEAGDACDNRLVPRPGDEGPYGSANCGDTVDNDCDRLVDSADPDCRQCQNSADCEDGNSCTVNSCESDHTCLTALVANGTQCDDGLYCTDPDQCMNGVCGGDPLNCGGLNDQCNRGACDEAGDRCAADPINEGQICDDGLYCNVDETCQSGSCTGGEDRDCSGESDQCNDGFCNEGLGQCQRTPVNEGSPCNDRLFCTDPDACSGGLCTGLQRNCSGAADQCNDGVCVEEVDSCEPQPKPAETPCNDGSYCTATDECNGTGTCVGTGDPCTTECLTVCNDTDDQCDPTAAGTSCTDDGAYCNGAEECDGAGNCGHTGDPCPSGKTCDEAGDTCVDSGCTSDSDCSSGDLCRPECASSPDGCVTPPGSLILTCDHPVDLVNADLSDCSINLGLAGQANCLSCTSEIGLVIVDRTGFEGCTANGWTLVSGDFCSDAVDNCTLGGSLSKTCCEQFATLCKSVEGNTSLRADEAQNCGGGHEQWRLEKTYDFSGLGNIQVCLDVADVNADPKQGVLIYAYDETNGPERVFCINNGPRQEVDGVFYRLCSSALGAWADDNPGVTLRIIGHSENNGRMMFIDNVTVKGWVQGCTPTHATVFTEDFTGCPDPLTSGWNDWAVSGTVKCVTGFDCYDQSSRAEADTTAGVFARNLDVSGLDGDIRLCFYYGDDGGNTGKSLLVEFDAGTGWQPAFAQVGNPGPDNSCKEVCINLSELDPAVNRNPALGIRFDMSTSGDKIDVDHITVSGAQFCDGAGTIEFGAFTESSAGVYDFTARDVPGTPLDAHIVCSWDTPPPGEEVDDYQLVPYRNPQNGWTRRRLLTLDNTGQGRDLIRFPVMIRLDGSRIDYGRAQDGGEDLRFVDADLGTVLPHEIEVWNESGDSVIWVAVPHIPANSSDHIWMYYGNPSAPDGQNPEGVWDRYFQGVWHLCEAGGTVAYDSTIHRRDGTYLDGPGLNQVGEYGDIAVLFDGSDDRVDLGGLDVVGALGDNGITLEVYARPDSPANEARLVSKSDGSGEGNHWWMLSLSNATRLRFRLKLDDNTHTLVASSGDVTSGEWFYGVAAYDGSGMKLYFKGQPAGGNANTGTISADSSKIALIGSNHDKYEPFSGLIGEVRISNIGRTPAWIRAQNLSLTDSFVTFGPEESF